MCVVILYYYSIFAIIILCIFVHLIYTKSEINTFILTGGNNIPPNHGQISVLILWLFMQFLTQFHARSEREIIIMHCGVRYLCIALFAVILSLVVSFLRCTLFHDMNYCHCSTNSSIQDVP